MATTVSKRRRRAVSLRDRLLSKAVINWETGCWEWTGRMSRSGYGHFGISSRANAYAHRLAYELLIGPIPAGLQLDHLCRVRYCINPAHLEPVTPRENIMRSPIAVASLHAAKTHCVNGHEFTPENTRMRSEGNSGVTRICRTCNRARGTASAARRRAARKAGAA